MRFTTFDELFNYRKYCLCGASLETEFYHLTINDADHLVVRYNGPVELVNNNSVIKIPCNIESRISPYGDVDFDVLANISSPTFKIDARFMPPHIGQSSIVSEEEFVKKHFSKNVQESLNIRVIRRCSVISISGIYANCPYRYEFSVGPITFNMRNKTLNELNMLDEHFSLPIEGITMSYIVHSNFKDNSTVITYPTRDKNFVIGKRESIEMPAEKFEKYPLDYNFLINKIKMLLLFS